MMNKFCEILVLFAVAAGVGADEVAQLRSIPVWKINYSAERGLPNSVQWRNNYPAGSARITTMTRPRLLVVNDFDPKKPFGEFSFTKMDVLNGFKDKIVMDFTLRPLDLGNKDFFFMALMRLKNRAGKEIPIIIKLGGERLSSSVGLAEYPNRLSDQPIRVTAYADLNAETMKLWLDDNLLLEGKILPEDKAYGTKLTFGDASNQVSGVYQLENFRVTTVE